MIRTVRNYTYANNPLTNDKFMKYHKIIIKKKKKSIRIIVKLRTKSKHNDNYIVHKNFSCI